VAVSYDGQAMSTSSNTEDLASAFTPEEKAHFERRYENNYDIADPQYMRWLKYQHPHHFQNVHLLKSYLWLLLSLSQIH